VINEGAARGVREHRGRLMGRPHEKMREWPGAGLNRRHRNFQFGPNTSLRDRRVSLSARIGCVFDAVRPTTVTLGGRASYRRVCNQRATMSPRPADSVGVQATRCANGRPTGTRRLANRLSAPRGGWKVRLLPFSAKTDTAKYSEIGIARYRVCIVVEKLGRYDCRTLVGGDARSATFRSVAAGFVARGRRTGARRGVYVSRKLGFRAAAHTVGCIRRNRLSSRSRSLTRPARAGSKSGWRYTDANFARRARVGCFTIGIPTYLVRRVTAFADVGTALLSGKTNSAKGSTLVDAHIDAEVAGPGGGLAEIVPTGRTRPPVTHPLDASIGCLQQTSPQHTVTDVTDESSTGRTYTPVVSSQTLLKFVHAALEPTVGAGADGSISGPLCNQRLGTQRHATDQACGRQVPVAGSQVSKLRVTWSSQFFC